MTSATVAENTTFKVWVQAARPFSYTAAIVPILVGAMYSLVYNPTGANLMWALFPVCMIAGILFQMGTNLVSEYFDYKKGVDREDTFGSSRVLVEEKIKPRKVLWGGILTFAVGFALGLILVYFRGTDMLILGLIGLLGGFFYTGFPIGYKYYALGDILVFALMGPLMVIGTYFAMTGHYDWNVFFISIPIGLLVAAILNANNIRDIMHDSQANIKTMAMLFGIQGSKSEYYFLVIGAFVSVITLVAIGVLHWVSLIVLISLKPAIDNIKFISKAEVQNPDKILMADVMTAKHHMMFGVLYSLSLLITHFVR